MQAQKLGSGFLLDGSVLLSLQSTDRSLCVYAAAAEIAQLLSSAAHGFRTINRYEGTNDFPPTEKEFLNFPYELNF